MRASTNISLKNRLSLTLDNFKGVDFSSSPIRVASNRASDMKNFINEYGVNRKRNGWNEIIRIKDNGIDLRINGVFNYHNQGIRKTIIHAGTKFFELLKSDDGYNVLDITQTCTYNEAKLVISRLKDQRSQCFIQEGKLFIIGCGDFLVYGSWNNGQSYELRRVFNNEDTYIPTTTISIDNDSTVDGTRSTLDAVNLLTSKRINQIVGLDSEEIKFTLDDVIDIDSTLEIKLETLNADNEYQEKHFINSGEDKTVLLDENDNIVGSILFETGQITLTTNTKPVFADRDNIFVTFHSSVESYEDRICNCNFGVLFGTNGSSNRLFLSGNESLPNYDFYSEVDDFTYFVDTNYAKLGSSAYAIKAYSRLSDSTLAIFKEDNNQEATVYFRTGTDNDSYDASGNLIQTLTVFPTMAGSIGEGVKSRFASANLSGDVLILSPNGLFGIVLGDNVSTAERYAKERSRYINEKLKQHANLEEAVAIVYKNRYYLSLEGSCYVADARFSSVEEGDMGDTFNYEWWYWDNIPARVWGILNDSLIFGTETGQICIFDNEFCDRSYYKTTEGQLSLSVVNNGITFSNSLGVQVAENDRISIHTDIYELVLNNSNNIENFPYIMQISRSRIYVKPEFIGLFYNGMEVFADNVGISGLAIDTKYIIADLDAGNCSFVLKTLDDSIASIRNAGFRLSRSLKDKELHITEVSNSMFKLKYLLDADPVRLVAYNNVSSSNTLASIILRKNVVAEWYSPVTDFGTNTQSKTLLKITISTDPSTNGSLQFGYETRNLERMHQARGMQTFSFDDMDFNNFTFESAFANSYSKRVLVRNFNYIMFKFKSDNDKNCIINNLTVVYKINKNNKGVK